MALHTFPQPSPRPLHIDQLRTLPAGEHELQRLLAARERAFSITPARTNLARLNAVVDRSRPIATLLSKDEAQATRAVPHDVAVGPAELDEVDELGEADFAPRPFRGQDVGDAGFVQDFDEQEAEAAGLSRFPDSIDGSQLCEFGGAHLVPEWMEGRIVGSCTQVLQVFLGWSPQEIEVMGGTEFAQAQFVHCDVVVK